MQGLIPAPGKGSFLQGFFRSSVGSGNLIQHVYSYNNIVNSEYASKDKFNCLEKAIVILSWPAYL